MDRTKVTEFMDAGMTDRRLRASAGGRAAGAHPRAACEAAFAGDHREQHRRPPGIPGANATALRRGGGHARGDVARPRRGGCGRHDRTRPLPYPIARMPRLSHPHMADPRQGAAAPPAIRAAARRRRPVRQPWERMTVLWNGDVALCTADAHGHIRLEACGDNRSPTYGTESSSPLSGALHKRSEFRNASHMRSLRPVEKNKEGYMSKGRKASFHTFAVHSKGCSRAMGRATERTVCFVYYQHFNALIYREAKTLLEQGLQTDIIILRRTRREKIFQSYGGINIYAIQARPSAERSAIFVFLAALLFYIKATLLLTYLMPERRYSVVHVTAAARRNGLLRHHPQALRRPHHPRHPRYRAGAFHEEAECRRGPVPGAGHQAAGEALRRFCGPRDNGDRFLEGQAGRKVGKAFQADHAPERARQRVIQAAGAAPCAKLVQPLLPRLDRGAFRPRYASRGYARHKGPYPPRPAPPLLRQERKDLRRLHEPDKEAEARLVRDVPRSASPFTSCPTRSAAPTSG